MSEELDQIYNEQVESVKNSVKMALEALIKKLELLKSEVLK